MNEIGSWCLGHIVHEDRVVGEWKAEQAASTVHDVIVLEGTSEILFDML